MPESGSHRPNPRPPTSGHPSSGPPSSGRSESDLGFTDRFVAAYTGRHDAEDALFWHEHPLSTAPSGARDPALRLSDLQRAVFSRSAPLDPLAPVELRRLTDELAGDRMAVEHALTVARAAPAEVDSGGEHPHDDETLEAEASVVSAPAPPRVPAWAVVAVATVLVALAVGRFASAPMQAESALAVFDRPAVAEDSLPGSSRFITLSGSEVAESRYLGTTSVWDIWGVRTVDGQVCVLAGVADVPLSACTSRASFVRDGVTLRLPADSMGRPLSVTWGPLEPQAVMPARESG